MRLGLLAGLLLLLIGFPAFAQDAESKAAAEALFREGTVAYEAGDFAVACKKIEDAVALTRGEALGGALLLAKCYEKQGRLASAWGAYSEVAGKAAAAGQADRATEATNGAAALLPKLHYLSVQVSSDLAAIEGAEIKRQGKPLRRELWTSRFPVDAGQVTFEVSAPGKRTESKSVTIPEGPGETPVTLGPLENQAAATPLPPVAPPTPVHHTPPVVSAEPIFWTGPRVFGIVIASVGAVAMGAGVGIGVAAKGDYDDAVADPANCAALPGGGFECTDVAPAEDARTLGDVGSVVFVAGTVTLAAGALMVVFLPTEEQTFPRVSLSADGAMMSWAGTF